MRFFPARIRILGDYSLFVGLRVFDWFCAYRHDHHMRLVWLSVIGLVCIGALLQLRSTVRASAETVAVEETVQSNQKAKGDRLDLLYRPQPEKRTLSAPPLPVVEPANAAPAVVTTPPKSESPKPTDTVSWHWRAGDKAITKISSNGEKTKLSRTKAPRKANE